MEEITVLLVPKYGGEAEMDTTTWFYPTIFRWEWGAVKEFKFSYVNEGGVHVYIEQ